MYIATCFLQDQTKQGEAFKSWTGLHLAATCNEQNILLQRKPENVNDNKKKRKKAMKGGLAWNKYEATKHTTAQHSSKVANYHHQCKGLFEIFHIKYLYIDI